jgi:hypothetical protein
MPFVIAELFRNYELVRKTIPNRARVLAWLYVRLFFGMAASAFGLVYSFVSFSGDLLVPMLLTATVSLSLVTIFLVKSSRIIDEAQSIADAGRWLRRRRGAGADPDVGASGRGSSPAARHLHRRRRDDDLSPDPSAVLATFLQVARDFLASQLPFEAPAVALGADATTAVRP